MKEARIVDKAIGRSEGCLGIVDCGLEARVVGDIDLRPSIRHVGEPLDFLRMARNQQERMPFASEGLRERASDSANSRQ